jgi:hypothetical protein
VGGQYFHCRIERRLDVETSIGPEFQAHCTTLVEREVLYAFALASSFPEITGEPLTQSAQDLGPQLAPVPSGREAVTPFARPGAEELHRFGTQGCGDAWANDVLTEKGERPGCIGIKSDLAPCLVAPQ